MKRTKALVELSAEEPPPPAIPSPAKTRYQQLADDVETALAALMSEIPKIQPDERRTKAFIRTHIGIPRDFVTGVVVAVEINRELAGMGRMNLPAAFTARHLRDALSGIVLNLLVAANQMQELIDTKEALVAADALSVYSVAQEMAKRTGNTYLRRFVADMKKALGRRGRPRKTGAAKKAQAAGQPAATPPAAPKKKRRRSRGPRKLEERLERRVEQ